MMEHTAAGRPVSFVGVAATAVLGLLPKLTCPLCWPAYAAALGALGLGFVDYTPYLLPLTALFVVVSIGALAWTALARRSALPLVLGTFAGAMLLIGRFVLESDVLTYAAIALLVIAPFLPVRRRAAKACPNCVSMPAEEIRQ